MLNDQGAQSNPTAIKVVSPNTLFYKSYPDPENDSKKTSINKILSQLMGKNAVWRRGQELAIMAAIRGASGLDLLVSFPTGSGKSLIYEVTGIYDWDVNYSVTVVIMPLVALMKDQWKRLYMCNVKAMIFYKDLQRHIYEGFIQQLRCHDYPVFILITPERFQRSEIRDIIQAIYEDGNLARFVLDEVHCFLQCHWRSAYSKLQHLHRDFVNVPIMAMSASLSTDDIEETLQVLQIPNCPIVRIPPDRPNLVYRVKMADDKKGDISKFIGEKYKEKTGIIYCTKTGDCEKVAKELQKKGVIAQAYYAALTDEEKSTLETNWMMGKLHVMVATIAFGMGIDKADVSFVIHFNMPTSLGDYYQESGRAGRNGKEAECVIYYNFTDSHMKYTLGRDSCRDSNKKLELRKLQEPTHKVMEMCLDPFRCRRWWILGHLNPTNAPQENCQACDVCLGEHDKNITHNLYNIAAMLVNLLIRVHAQYSYDDSEYHVHPDRLAEICMIPTSRSAEKSRSIAQQCGWDGSEASQSFPNGQKLTITRLARICAYLVLNEVFIEYPRDCGKYGPRWYLAVGPRVDEFLQHPSSEFPVPMPI